MLTSHNLDSNSKVVELIDPVNIAVDLISIGLKIKKVIRQKLFLDPPHDVIMEKNFLMYFVDRRNPPLWEKFSM